MNAKTTTKSVNSTKSTGKTDTDIRKTILTDKVFPERPYEIVKDDSTELAYSLPKHSQVSNEAIRTAIGKIKRYVVEDEDQKKAKATLRQLLDRLIAHKNCLSGNLAVLNKLSKQSDLINLLDELESEGKILQDIFDKGIEKALEKQRPMEIVIRSLTSFFDESECNGQAEQVWIINGHFLGGEYADSLQEGDKAILNLEEIDGEHPFFNGRLETDGTAANQISFQNAENIDVVDAMGAILVPLENFKSRPDIQNLALRMSQAKALAVIDIDPEVHGTVGREFAAKAKLGELKEKIHGDDPSFKHIAVCVQKPLIRKKTAFDKENIVGYSSAALAGIIYKNEEFGLEGRTITRDPANSEDGLGDWCIEPAYKPLWDIAELRDSVRAAFLGDRTVESGRPGGRILPFLSSWTPYDTVKGQSLSVTLGQNLLYKVVKLLMMHAQGKDKTSETAKDVARGLNRTLANLQRDGYFFRASCEPRKAGIEERDGVQKLVLAVDVEYRDGIRDVEVNIDGTSGGDERKIGIQSG